MTTHLSFDDPRWGRPKTEIRQEGRRTPFAGLLTVSPARHRQAQKVLSRK
ncbi:hypothetical protein PC116_g18137 [Phytophthora cactorum]|nr:hypothetical protein C6341_g16257 [Phytophthora cactorum]KAG3167188.1 hypothetical protein PC128_g19537 [Phytophthora cactorum]KAG4233682.1 hypothetical protein PC116_g18137 [Phytophthora cactorum]